VNYCWTADDQFSLMCVGSNWRTGYSPRPGQSVEEALDDRYVHAHIDRIAGPRARYRIVHKAAYTVHRRLLPSFRRGRVLFAGDAAHLNSPSGGMGMNSGIHDAYVLANALAAVMTGASESHLDVYAQTRREVAVEDVQRASDRHHRMHRERDPSQRQANWTRLQRIAADPDAAEEYLLGSSMLRSLIRHGVAPIPPAADGGIAAAGAV
jgi:3-(3-hydroxy-phenyl)propionate hydroxylase